jgi:putative endonuclease
MGMSDDTPSWCLYLIECRNGAYYAGITNDMEARYAAHAAGRGARFTRANPPVRLLGVRPFAGRAEASRAEWEIKQLPREKKLAFLLARSPDQSSEGCSVLSESGEPSGCLNHSG